MPELFIFPSQNFFIEVGKKCNYLGHCITYKYALRDFNCACGRNLTFLTLIFGLDPLLE